MRKRKPTRREFMSKAAALGMAGAVGGCATTGEPGEMAEVAETVQPEPIDVAQLEPAPAPERQLPAPGENIRLGWIGVGSRGSGVLRDALKFDGVDIVAVCDAYDVWRNRAVSWCEDHYPEVADYVLFEEMIANEELNAVAISTPDHIHYPAAMAALNAGLDVYCEKPMTLSWDEAAALQRRVNETGAVFQVGTQLRSLPMYGKVREWYQQGQIGDVVEVNVNRHSGSGSIIRKGPPKEANRQNVHWDAFLRDTKPYDYDPVRYFLWRMFNEYSNGVSGDLMVHHLDLAHYVTGASMPDRVMSVGGIYTYDDGRTVPDTISTIIEYPEKFHVNYTTTLANGHYGLTERYLGTDGTIEIQGMGNAKLFRKGYEEEFRSEGIVNTPHLEDFFTAIRTREKTIAPAEAGFMGAACASMAVLSEQTGESVKWDRDAQRVYV